MMVGSVQREATGQGRHPFDARQDMSTAAAPVAKKASAAATPRRGAALADRGRMMITRCGWPISPVAQLPPVVLAADLAEPPVPVVPLQLHRPPAQRHLRVRINRADERPRLV